MIKEQNILTLTALFLIASTMFFGVGYAVFDEHQTLVGMCTLMATGFMVAAGGNMDASFAALDSYDALSQEYGYEVYSHDHWGMLSLILLILGLVFQQLGLSEKQGLALAWLMAVSTVFFPLGVLLQIGPAAAVRKVLAVPASAGLVLRWLIAAMALLRKQA